MPQESQNSKLQFNISYNSIWTHTAPQLPVWITQCGTLTCLVLSRGKVPQSKLSVCQNTLYRSQWASGLSVLNLRKHNMVTAERSWNSGCSKYLQKFGGDTFPTKGFFFSVSPLLWLNPLYLSLNRISFPYVTVWLAFTLPLMERTGSVKEKGISW